ncbi:MAG: DNA-binding transcriptional LysR family regulator [Myxococcota bacterium]|jgi:DNA-binding transcriptional LysR family regulator
MGQSLKCGATANPVSVPRLTAPPSDNSGERESTSRIAQNVMPGPMDRLSSLEIFVKVLDTGSFTEAARLLSVSKSHVSKQVRQLEDRLGVRLINRTTRQVSATDAGQAFYERCASIIENLDDAEQALSQLNRKPAGTLRVNGPVSFGIRHLAPAIGTFMVRHENLRVDLTLNDRVVNIVDEGFDLAIRIGKLADSSLIARRLAPVSLLLCASPDYLDRRGRPETAADLKEHDCLLYRYLSTGNTWHVGDETVRVDGRLMSDNGDVLCHAATSGVGVAFLPDFLVDDAIRSGKLEVVLPEQRSDLSVWAVYPHSRHLSAKVRLFIDFLVDRYSPYPPWKCG